MAQRTKQQHNGVVPEEPVVANGDGPVGAPTQDETPQHPGVLVLRVPTDKPGEEQVQVLPINGMDTLAVPILLEYAIRIHKQNLGLTERN